MSATNSSKYVTLGASMLTPGERLFLQRHREGWTIKQAARKHGVSVYKYRGWESDLETAAIEKPGVGSLTPQEKCVVMRRRSGRSTVQVARQLGCCRLWLKMMEDGRADVARLQEFWRVR